MAGPLIQLLQGLRGRRMRRRGGWGGGDSPSMRNIINPLDSQDMTDRAQGVDISRAMPSTRLETRISEPAAESFATAQLPNAAAPSVAAPAQVAAEFDQPSQPSPAFRTAAGSNAVSSPMQTQQCPGGICPTGPSMGGGLDPSRYPGLKVAPGEILVRVDEQPSGSPAPSGAMPSQPGMPAIPPAAAIGQASAGVSTADGLTPWQGWVRAAAANPQSTNWLDAARAAADESKYFADLSKVTMAPSWKVFYGQQSMYWQRESANAIRAHQLQQSLLPRQQMAEQALNKDSLKSRMSEGYQFLATPDPVLRPGDKAAAFARQFHKDLPDEQLEKTPVYQEAAKVAHAGEIAHLAAIATTAEPTGYPWGTQESRQSGASAAWKAASARYGAMPFEQAVKEIEDRFTPAYKQALMELNANRPNDQRMSEAEIVQKAEDDSRAMYSQIYWDQNPDVDEAAPAQQPAPQPAARPQPADRIPASVRAWGGG